MERTKAGLVLTRKINKKGAITIPSFVRDHLNLRPGEPVTLTVTEDNKILIGAAVPTCAFCGSVEKLRITEMGSVCSKCFSVLRATKVQ